MIERGARLTVVRDLLGHASTTTTERYEQTSKQALREALALQESDGFDGVLAAEA